MTEKRLTEKRLTLKQCPMCASLDCLAGSRGSHIDTDPASGIAIEFPSINVFCNRCQVSFIIPADMYDDNQVTLLFAQAQPPKGEEWKDSLVN